MEYDKFPPMSQLNLSHVEFEFFPSRYEVWKDQQLFESGNLDNKLNMVSGKVSDLNFSNSVLEISVYVSKCSNYLNRVLYFDIAFTSNDRIMCVRIPPANQNDSRGLIHFRNVTHGVVGVTTQEKSTSRQPWACSMFFIDSELDKLAFTISYPALMIEFYKT